MGAPAGNKNAVGNKGGGRKSAYQEQVSAQDLFDLWNNEVDTSKVLEKIKSKRYSARDMFISKLVTGNDKALMALFRKLFPDKLSGQLEVDSDFQDLLKILHEQSNNLGGSNSKGSE